MAPLESPPGTQQNPLALPPCSGHWGIASRPPRPSPGPPQLHCQEPHWDPWHHQQDPNWPVTASPTCHWDPRNCHWDGPLALPSSCGSPSPVPELDPAGQDVIHPGLQEGRGDPCQRGHLGIVGQGLGPLQHLPQHRLHRGRCVRAGGAGQLWGTQGPSSVTSPKAPPKHPTSPQPQHPPARGPSRQCRPSGIVWSKISAESRLQLVENIHSTSLEKSWDTGNTG